MLRVARKVSTQDEREERRPLRSGVFVAVGNVLEKLDYRDLQRHRNPLDASDLGIPSAALKIRNVSALQSGAPRQFLLRNSEIGPFGPDCLAQTAAETKCRRFCSFTSSSMRAHSVLTSLLRVLDGKVPGNLRRSEKIV